MGGGRSRGVVEHPPGGAIRKIAQAGATLDRGARRARRRMSPAALMQLRVEREQVLARYDSGAIPLSIYFTLREIEEEISWAEHRAEYEEAQI
jgi:hypothetical protein